MERWNNKVAVVTGASAGIGSAASVDLVKAGMKVVALARREDKLSELKRTLPSHLQKKFHVMKCDVANEAEVIKVFQWIESNVGVIHVLVNNAGIQKKNYLMGKGNSKDIRDVVDINLMGAVFCVREAYQQMKAHNIKGHIILINSIFGHSVPVIPNTELNIYFATKHAVTAMTETYRQEFSNDGTDVKITSLSPGAVDTDILPDTLKAAPAFPMLNCEDISGGILYCISTPPHVQVHEIIIRPLHEKL
ncbi:DHRS11.2 family protein [Megaselia abdita]